MKNNNLLLFIYGALCVLIGMTIGYITFNEPKQISPTKYKMYYEYDLINNDTIPVDTIYTIVP
jgi:hypothetical protein